MIYNFFLFVLFMYTNETGIFIIPVSAAVGAWRLRCLGFCMRLTFRYLLQLYHVHGGFLRGTNCGCAQLSSPNCRHPRYATMGELTSQDFITLNQIMDLHLAGVLYFRLIINIIIIFKFTLIKYLKAFILIYFPKSQFIIYCYLFLNYHFVVS
jgi:hypothetical protein